MSNKRLITYFGGLFAAFAVLIIAAIAFSDSSDSSTDKDVRHEDDSGGDAFGICLEGATDCVDTVEPGSPGGTSDDADAPRDTSVSDEKQHEPDQPVITSPPDDGSAPSAPDCTTPEAAAACQARATEIALTDLTGRLGVDASTITVVSIEDAVFDGCMGVEPPPGQACTEIGILGYEIIFEHEEGIYTYHTDQGTKAVFVE